MNEWFSDKFDKSDLLREKNFLKLFIFYNFNINP